MRGFLESSQRPNINYGIGYDGPQVISLKKPTDFAVVSWPANMIVLHNG